MIPDSIDEWDKTGKYDDDVVEVLRGVPAHPYFSVRIPSINTSRSLYRHHRRFCSTRTRQTPQNKKNNTASHIHHLQIITKESITKRH